MKRTLWIAMAVVMCTACGSKEKEYDATGTFEATEVVVSAQSQGVLLSFSVNEGEEVAKDAHVGQIKDEEMHLRKRELSSATDQLGSQLRSLARSAEATDSRQLDLQKQIAAQQQQLSNLQCERQRYAELVADGAVARKQLDDLDYQVGVQQRQLAALREQLGSTNASLAKQAEATREQMRGIEAQMQGVEMQKAQLDERIRDAAVVSPLGGYVLEKYAEQGEYVTIGKPLFRLADTRQMFLRAYVTTHQLERVKLGQKVKVFADYGGGQRKTYDGTIAWVSSRAEFTPKNIVTDDERADLVYAVKIAVANDGYIKIGMYGEVKF